VAQLVQYGTFSLQNSDYLGFDSRWAASGWSYLGLGEESREPVDVKLAVGAHLMENTGGGNL